jgi:disulfide bond formation protein DsbB
VLIFSGSKGCGRAWQLFSCLDLKVRSQSLLLPPWVVAIAKLCLVFVFVATFEWKILFFGW